MSSVSTAASTPSQANWAFFPLYPMLGAGLSNLTGISPLASLLVVSNLCFLTALVWIRHETREIYGSRAADLVVLLLCLVPGTHVFSSAYPEASFLLFVVGTLAMARKRRWLAAGFLAALAVLTRNFGILLLVPMAIYFVEQEATQTARAAGPLSGLSAIAGSKHLPAFSAAVLLPCLALLGFMVFLHFRAGDFLAFATIQSAWGRSANWPFLTLIRPLVNLSDLEIWIWPNIVAGWAAAGLSIALVRHRQWAHAGFSIVGLTILLTAGILSLFRLVLPIAPLFMVAGRLLAPFPRLAVAVLAIASMAEVCLMWGWSRGWPIY